MPAKAVVFPIEIQDGDEIKKEYGWHCLDGNERRVSTAGESITREEDAWRAFRNATVAMVEALAEHDAEAS